MSNQGFGGGPPQGESQPPRPRRAYVEPEDSGADQPTLVEQSPPAQEPQRGYPPSSTMPADAPVDERDPGRLPLILGIVILVAVAAVIAYLLLRDRGAETAEPAPAPVTSSAAPASPTQVAPSEPDETAAAPETTVLEPAPPTEEAAPPTEEPTTETAVVEEPAEEPVDPTGEPQELTAADLPATLAGYTLEDEMVYEQGEQKVFVSALGIAEMDPEWQEMTFPGAAAVADNASCMSDDENAQGCYIQSSTFGVVTASGDPGVDITEFVQALADHLR